MSAQPKIPDETPISRSQSIYDPAGHPSLGSQNPNISVAPIEIEQKLFNFIGHGNNILQTVL